MGNFKLNLDRPKISSEQIQARQNFDEVLTKFKASQSPIYKNPWFWGSAGLASVGLATMISLNALSNQNETHDKNLTSNNLSLPEDTPCVKAPVKDEDMPYQTFVVNPAKGDEIKLPTGTEISIPKNSLQTANTNAPVEIQVREFRDKASAFVAGIPMDFETSAFESAGMIEIRAVQNGEKVTINPAKPIEVTMHPTKNPADFDFWYLNEKKQEWEKYPVQVSNTPLTENATTSERHTGFDQMSKQKQAQVLESQLKKDAADVKEFTAELDKLKKPQAADFNLATKGHQKFDLDFSKKDYPELASFENLVFEVVPTEGYDKSFTKKAWQNAKLDKRNERYYMLLSSSSDKFEIEVRPIVEGKDQLEAQKRFDAAIAEYNQAKQKLEQAKQEAEAQKRAHEAELKKLLGNEIRTDATTPFTLEDDASTETKAYQEQIQLHEKSAKAAAAIDMATFELKFQTNRWGVFNCDNPIAYPNAFESEPALTWEGGGETRFAQITVFNLEKDTRYTYNLTNLSEFGLHRGDDVVILGITSDGQVGYLEMKNRPKKETIDRLVFKRRDADTKLYEWLKDLLDEGEAKPA